ncbi:hypothetical protein [Nocardioides donggukensis]|uniref:hypothetical protein n=1 Tax=Nocardioides donggukensis TaxID=2774019 RepID=UPI00191CE47D|nr:hypothetical protein [Nocardioides donggukensis]
MPNDALLEAADGLYGLDLPAFTPARDELAKSLRAEDRPLSDAVKRLRKPSLAAWAVNLLVRREAEQVEQVLTVGAALREAQTNLDGDELRALTRQRRQLTAAVTTRARSLASEQGQRITPAVAEQVEGTLTAAMVDADAAAAVRTGLLVSALAATGVGELDVASALAVPEAAGFTATPVVEQPPTPPDLHVVPDPDADAKRLAAAEQELAEADAEVERARQAHTAADADVEALEARSLQTQAELEELRRRLAELEDTADEIDDELTDARAVLASAQDDRSAADSARERAAAAVDRLRG